MTVFEDRKLNSRDGLLCITNLFQAIHSIQLILITKFSDF